MFQIKCKNGIDGAIFEPVTDFAGKIEPSDPATTSNMGEEKVINDLDLTGVSHIANPVEGSTVTKDHLNKRNESEEKRNILNAKHEIISFLEQEQEKEEEEKETRRMATQDASGLSETVERVTQSREKQEEVKIDMPLTAEQHGHAKQEIDFSAGDLLCFAWQIARGMVSAEIETLLYYLKYNFTRSLRSLLVRYCFGHSNIKCKLTSGVN